MNDKTIITYESMAGKLTFNIDSPFWITDVDGMSAVEIDIGASRSAGQTGASITAQSVKPRSFTLDGAIFEPVQSNRTKLLGIITPQMRATLTVIQGGESWYLDVVPEKTPEITPGESVQYFQTRLYAEYPYWRTTASRMTQIAGIVAMFRFPFYTGGVWRISSYGGSYFSTVENKGNVPMTFKAVFVARGVLEWPELYHMGTGQKILIKKEMVTGERVVVSTLYGEKSVICISPGGESSNGFRYLSFDSDLSMQLLPGENLMRIDAVANREGLQVLIDAPQGVKSGV